MIAEIIMRRFIAFALFTSLTLAGLAASAHTLTPTVVTITFNQNATFDIEITVNAEALLAEIGTQHDDTDDSPNAPVYNRLREMEPDQLRYEFERFVPDMLERLDARFDDVRISLAYKLIEIPAVGEVGLERYSFIDLSGEIPAGARQFAWRYPEEYGSNVLRLRMAESDEVRAAWLQQGEFSEPFALVGELAPRSRREVAFDYTVLGFTHILPLGLDHILFVLGIFLLSLQLAPILWQVSAFTVAHTITLGMTIYGLISLPTTIVEPLIAASIVYVGVENIVIGQLKPWRVVIVFCFGLLHGMGFAGVLGNIGLPESEFLTALLTFNIGVELGQLAVIGLALLTVGWFRNRSWYRQRIVIPISALISIIGAYWTVERLL